MRTPIPPPRHYQISGPLGANGDQYKVEFVGPTINAASFRQLIKMLEMTAEWLEDDERSGIEDPIATRMKELAEDGKPPVTGPQDDEAPPSLPPRAAGAG